MAFEFYNKVKIEPQPPQSKEAQWMANLSSAWNRVQQITDECVMLARPDTHMSPPPSLIIVSDDSFNQLALQTIEDTVVIEPATALAKQKSLVKEGKTTIHAMYLPDLRATIIPTSFAKIFQQGGIKRVQATMVLMEEYLHHVTTVPTAMDTAQMGFYELTAIVSDQHEPISTGIYMADMLPDRKTTLPEAGGDQNVLLTESATQFLVYLLAQKLQEPILAQYSLVMFGAQGANGQPEGAFFTPTSPLRKAIITALLQGNPKGLDFTTQDPVLNKSVNIKKWLERGPEMKLTNNPVTDKGIPLFSYNSFDALLSTREPTAPKKKKRR